MGCSYRLERVVRVNAGNDTNSGAPSPGTIAVVAGADGTFHAGEVRLRCVVTAPQDPSARASSLGSPSSPDANGPRDPPLVLLLHGFPESASSWEGVQRELAAKGYRVVAPDMRGYGGSDKPWCSRSSSTASPS
jgi:pimeloyl-ACP methyl ester carboxylesterase